MKNSDICLSIRMVRAQAGAPGATDRALALLDALRPTRVEWSYCTDRALIARFKQVAPVFVAALNTIAPPGRAENFEGAPIIAPWMTRFGTPDARRPYMCQNHPDDVRARLEQAVALIADGTTDSFQHDDWACNAQMLWFPNACFCEHCRREFAAELGLDLDYRRYLRARGFTHSAQVHEAAKRGEVPLWDDYTRFQRRSVTRYFRKLRAAMDQALARPATLSVNGSVTGFGGDIALVLPFIEYFNGETYDFTPTGLLKLAEASRQVGKRQVVSFFPRPVSGDYDEPAFVARVRQAIGLSYCLGLLPLFPYDVYAGNDHQTGELRPRWYGTMAQYGAPYEVVRAHPEWVDEYRYVACDPGPAAVTVLCEHVSDPRRRLRHTLAADGAWATAEVSA